MGRLVPKVVQAKYIDTNVTQLTPTTETILFVGLDHFTTETILFVGLDHFTTDTILFVGLDHFRFWSVQQEQEQEQGWLAGSDTRNFCLSAFKPPICNGLSCYHAICTFMHVEY